jgi:hypothetical protein
VVHGICRRRRKESLTKKKPEFEMSLVTSSPTTMK